ncbi:pyruvate flavodoxin/ferredoxin oxidoreductase domain protein (plasmid) [Gemmatirosa kalamazoonensis]|uniref:Pyruvate flavodoxin/ferredoxin oxidoreductase domain protein n=1 Tax=Gemmatirosa kalamazoonensis TaxID=861299 RepID=W0RSQ8_9BACT|nr:2-oxoacid:acceptor oxidoreductase family protein [Gemmatirosa kalamazoonensis]AHG92618.1 pyruvate flavodoxin/ferredoxin oxidoreductase domain protein [Gemmatirosa kalamazoonensis]
MITFGKAARAAAPKPDVPAAPPRYPGTPSAMDGSTAVVLVETAASEGAGAYPITPSTQMGEGWAAAVAEGKRNVNGRKLLFFEPEGEHAAAAVTAGMSMTGLRAANFSSGQGVVYMHESLYPAVGKRLTYVLNIAARAITKHALNVHAGHDDYHAVDDTGFFQLFAKDVQEAADLNLIAHRVAELSLNPGIVAQDGFLTSHVLETMRAPEPGLVREFLGDPSDVIDAPTPAQRLVFGAKRRRIPELFAVDHPAMLGVVQNQDSFAQGVAAQRPFYFDHVAELTDRAMEEFARLTGRRHARCSGYRLADAEYVVVGQGSVVSNAEAVADWLRATHGLKAGVLNLTMFRPFPADLVTRLLAGKKAVVVLERTDQPLAVDPPLLREIRAAMGQGVENGRALAAAPNAVLPHPRVAAVDADEVPEFYAGCFGLGSRDLQPGDIAAAVLNMTPAGAHRRQFYLGVDFVRPETRLPKLQIWQEQLLESYPHLADLSLPSAGDLDLMPNGSVSLRIHSVGGWGAITMGKNVAMTVFELLGMHIKANPKYGSEKKGQPTTFYATFAHEPIRLNCELTHVDVVLSPDPNVFRHSNPLAGIRDGGVFVIQSDLAPADFWAALPARARREIVARKVRVFVLDAFAIAQSEASDAELRYRMQGAAFMGAFFETSPLLAREGVADEKLFAGIRKQLAKKFGAKGERVVEDNLRVIRRGATEVREVTPVALADDAAPGAVPAMPALLDAPDAEWGVGNPGRFWEQVCVPCKLGQDGIADPFAAIGAIPAATSAVRDMTDVRLEVPRFLAEKCTGCAQCWTQCPDAAIPGLVSDPEEVLAAAAAHAATRGTIDRVKPLLKPLGREVRRLVGAEAFTSFADTLAAAATNVLPKLVPDAAKRATVEEELALVRAAIAEFPLAKTKTFWDGAERRQKGSGGLLSVTVNPEACKGCNLCVDVCPDGALVTVRQDDATVATLRDNWRIWQRLPDTPSRFVNVSDIDQGIGVLPTLLLRKESYRSMAGGDGACMGCGEKTAVHLVVSAIEAMMRPRVERQIARLGELIAGLDAKARGLLSADADLDAVMRVGGHLTLDLDDEKRGEMERLTRAIHDLKDLRWRYAEGPSTRGRAHLAMANSTGCSSVWASTYPFNPYPFPWANHLFQDSPSLAIGVFEGHMRKMADGFAAVRRAETLLGGTYDAQSTERELADLDWRTFTDDEFALCPPIVAMGGDGAMLDIGFQNLSRLLASAKPIRVIVLDTQVYSNTGGQACTSGFTGQVSDMAWYGAATHGKTEVRKELALIALAHRGVYVHQSSQASASHLMAGVLRGLQKRRPALFNIYTPCPVEHGLADDSAQHAARLALESRAFPFVTFDPDAGPSFAQCLSLDGNPSLDDAWPTYTLEYVDADGAARSMELPLTTADWAATEGRFRKHFTPIAQDDDAPMPFHEYLAASAEARAGRRPFVYVLTRERTLARWSVSDEMVRLAEERQLFWAQLRELAGVRVSDTVRERVAESLEAALEARLDAARREYEAKIAELKASYPQTIATRLAETLLRSSRGEMTVRELLARVPDGGAAESIEPQRTQRAAEETTKAASSSASSASSAVKNEESQPPIVAKPIAESPMAVAEARGNAAVDALAVDAYIESDRCTTCNECINLNKKLFAYNADKQAYVKDATAGTFAQLVMAAEKCPVSAIHPGTPLNPKEKDLDKWLKRAQAF